MTALPCPSPTSERAELLARHGARATPRYTSYPTAPHFEAGFTAADYGGWLAEFDTDAPISLYLHVPYCREMCWYCACNMRLASDYGPVGRYVESLLEEVELLAAALPARMRISHLHWGGGTPTALSPTDLTRVMERVRDRFIVDDDAELAIESDPRTLEAAMIATIGALGFTRASFGVQEFEPVVQQAINRIQPPEQVAAVVEGLRRAGVGAINFDLIYGLPHQSVATLTRTIELCREMRPDRIALFGYAHVPWKASRQRLIHEDALPGLRERAEQAGRAAELLREQGYVPIGLDHHALPDDSLARAAADGTLRRNFQGYTTDQAETLLGLGTTAIGRTPRGYFQNLPGVRDWRTAIAEGRLPVRRSRAFRGDDRLRGEVIEQIMCRGQVDCAALGRHHGADEGWAADSLAALGPLVTDGIVRISGDELELAPWARSLARVVAAAFDSYLPTGPGRHAVSV